VGRNPTNRQVNFETHILGSGQELATAALEDEGERRGQRWIVEDTKHVVVVGELEQEVLRLVPLRSEAVTRNVEAVHNPLSNVWQRHPRTSAADDRDQRQVQGSLLCIDFIRTMDNADVGERPSTRRAQREGGRVRLGLARWAAGKMEP
jgi:hypothetical protein